ncbi:aspartate/glutamate racemase family protein [Paenibacillus sp. LS1]|uniref:aspartate/glutamate racemase family protein n=1 Tax=Paenibacillus sp. LS1 TaxID=2992120 RepID=UPI002232C719|nr:aspartate/glutamate racemase family protein [Paenibacillus sp. LS1]MCW3795773.1 aspartate/glutamate racemase family protein [Paenibacillus sp. LS1]
MITIGCFHAHYSNIALIEETLAPYEVELVHYVDPGLDRLKHDADFSEVVIHEKVAQTLQWIAECHANAILVTCTLFATVLEQEAKQVTVPVIGIDDPLLQEMRRVSGEFIIVFTNPATVEGTMVRVNQALQQQHEQGDETVQLHVAKVSQTEAVCIPGTFELIMRGDQKGYLEAVREGLQQIAEQYPGKRVIAAQLSMAPAAAQVTIDRGIPIHSPLSSLATYLEENLGVARQ